MARDAVRSRRCVPFSPRKNQELTAGVTAYIYVDYLQEVLAAGTSPTALAMT